MQTASIESYRATGQHREGQPQPAPRLARAAHEFEGQMMKELLQPLTSNDLLPGASDDSSSGSGGALGEFASEALGQALSLHGGFGIANRVIHTLSPAGNHHLHSPVTQNPHGDTVINTSKSLTS